MVWNLKSNEVWKMNKVIVIGSPGAGKSVFSRLLSQKTELPLIHLDMIWHRPDKTHISRDEFDEFLQQCFKEKQWIMDGDYSRTIEIRFENADTVFFLDYSVETCLAGIQQRVGQKRVDMPWIADYLDADLIQSIENYPNNGRGKVYELIEKYKGCKDIIVFTSRAEAKAYLEML